MDLKISKNGARLITEGKDSSTVKLDPKLAKKIMKYSKEYGDVFQRIADDVDDGNEIDKGEMRELIYSLRQIGPEDRAANQLANKLYRIRNTPEPQTTNNANNTQPAQTQPTMPSRPEITQEPAQMAPTVSSEPNSNITASTAAVTALEESKIKEIYDDVLKEFDPSGVFHDYTDKDPAMAQKIKARDQAKKNAQRRQKRHKPEDDWKPGKELDVNMPGSGGVDWGKWGESLKIIREFEKKHSKSLNEEEIRTVFKSLFERLVKEGKVRKQDEEESNEEKNMEEAADTTRRDKKIEKNGVPQRRDASFNESKSNPAKKKLKKR